jgi:thiosulfate dehydrogenase [quinone] large subunit
MKQSQKLILFLLRIATGWLFLYAGFPKILNPDWSAAGYLSGAKTFSALFAWFAQPGVLPWVNVLNEWGLALIGVSLILGFLVRWSTIAGVLLMVFYYLPILSFPHVGDTSYLVDQHFIFALVLLTLNIFHAGRIWGIDARTS